MPLLAQFSDEHQKICDNVGVSVKARAQDHVAVARSALLISWTEFYDPLDNLQGDRFSWEIGYSLIGITGDELGARRLINEWTMGLKDVSKENLLQRALARNNVERQQKLASLTAHMIQPERIDFGAYFRKCLENVGGFVKSLEAIDATVVDTNDRRVAGMGNWHAILAHCLFGSNLRRPTALDTWLATLATLPTRNFLARQLRRSNLSDQGYLMDEANRAVNDMLVSGRATKDLPAHENYHRTKILFSCMIFDSLSLLAKAFSKEEMGLEDTAKAMAIAAGAIKLQARVVESAQIQGTSKEARFLASKLGARAPVLGVASSGLGVLAAMAALAGKPVADRSLVERTLAYGGVITESIGFLVDLDKFLAARPGAQSNWMKVLKFPIKSLVTLASLRVYVLAVRLFNVAGYVYLILDLIGYATCLRYKRAALQEWATRSVFGRSLFATEEDEILQLGEALTTVWPPAFAWSR
jgi:hypothetical protein